MFQKYLTWYECIKTPHCGHINVKKFYNIHSLIELTLFSEAFFEQFFFSEFAKEMNDMIAILAHSHLEIVIQAMAKKLWCAKKHKISHSINNWRWFQGRAFWRVWLGNYPQNYGQFSASFNLVLLTCETLIDHFCNKKFFKMNHNVRQLRKILIRNHF